MWRIASDLATLDRQTIILDSALQVIALKNIALNRAELTIQAQDSAYRAKETEATQCRLLVANQEQIHKIELKTAQKKGFKKGVNLGIVAFVAFEIGKAVLKR